MPSLKLFQRNLDRPSLRQRADAIRASVARVIDQGSADVVKTGREPGHDADLLALEAEFRQADLEHDAAVATLCAAWDRYVEPPMPKELWARRFDWIHTAIPRPRIVATEGGTRTLPYGGEDVERMRGLRCVRPSYGGAGEVGPDGTRVVPDVQVQERVDGIVAAWDRWKAEIEAAEAALGISGLRAARDAAEGRRIALLERIRETPARTLAGLGAKARAAAAVIGAEDVRAEGRDGFTADDPAALPYELVADLLALAGGLPDTHKASV